MNADDTLREAISEAVDEVLSDNRINPDDEVDRLKTMVDSIFWDCYNTRAVRCPECERVLDADEELTDVDGGDMCPSCLAIFQESIADDNQGEN